MRGKTIPQKWPGYYIKPSDSEAPDIEIWEIWNTLTLILLPGLILPSVVAPGRVLSIAQIEQSVCKQISGVKL